MLIQFAYTVALILAVAGYPSTVNTNELLNSHAAVVEAKETELASLPNGTSLNAIHPAQGGIFQGIDVRTKDIRKTFVWSNVNNETYYPAVGMAQLGTDGNQKMVVFLTKGYGTGVLDQEPHVLNLHDLSERPVENPVEAVKQQVKSRITKAGGKVNIIVQTDAQKIEKSYDETYAAVWNEYVGFGSIVKYELSNNQIIAFVPGNVSAAEFAVTVRVEYDSDLKVKNITLIET
jgi:hypothetical protein